MSNLVVGEWVLIACGVALFVRGLAMKASVRLIRQIGLLVVAFVMIGVGTFGLQFLKDFRPYLDALKLLTEATDVAAYSKFYDQVASGKLPAEVATVGLAFTLERPVPNMGAALDRAIQHAGNRPQKALLAQAKHNLEAKAATARDLVIDAAAKGGDLGAQLQRCDPSLQRLMAKPLQELARQHATQFQIDPKLLHGLASAGESTN